MERQRRWPSNDQHGAAKLCSYRQTLPSPKQSFSIRHQLTAMIGHGNMSIQRWKASRNMDIGQQNATNQIQSIPAPSFQIHPVHSTAPRVTTKI
jgi:hypothetical protein